MVNGIENGELLVEAYGNIPSFHDAEVVDLSLTRQFNGDREPVMNVLISYLTFNREEENGELVKNYHDVDLTFTGIFGFKLENFNHQNVLGSPIISEFSGKLPDDLRQDVRLLGVVSRAEIDNLKFYIKFDCCFGIEAEFFCKSVIVNSVTRVPGN